eukprot:CAMPEP_0181179688 /NCGR_PEP_ID=MMETSP1096-20121128/6396_1 /TAXON_ID=156174 ORGANISM="Chrysochromulina ericina, Strain CCMP281" /NCGR_SAMPLE_ID=MMETSP1096 /ASSEMBLY_ACC=CAM_ASM_000453 /LENGTH=37 /DNA_ID= /DNA_START= /DNA_END= /DNA_ORIENTATION=
MQNCPVHRLKVARVEGRGPYQHLEYQGAETPPIHRHA